jgi:hypothetical protein
VVAKSSPEPVALDVRKLRLELIKQGVFVPVLNWVTQRAGEEKMDYDTALSLAVAKQMEVSDFFESIKNRGFTENDFHSALDVCGPNDFDDVLQFLEKIRKDMQDDDKSPRRKSEKKQKYRDLH